MVGDVGADSASMRFLNEVSEGAAVVVTVNGEASRPGSVRVVAAAPGIFQFGQRRGPDFAAAEFGDGEGEKRNSAMVTVK